MNYPGLGYSFTTYRLTHLRSFTLSRLSNRVLSNIPVTRTGSCFSTHRILNIVVCVILTTLFFRPPTLVQQLSATICRLNREPQSCESSTVVSFNAHRHTVDSAHRRTVKPKFKFPRSIYTRLLLVPCCPRVLYFYCLLSILFILLQCP